jgi:HlyD family secretion protein
VPPPRRAIALLIAAVLLPGLTAASCGRAQPDAGTLADLRVTAGQRVAKGAVLAVIDSPEVADRLSDAERAPWTPRRACPPATT